MIKLALLEVHLSNPLDSIQQMNINHFIKIKKIPYKDYSLTRYIRGAAFRKNISHKKMNAFYFNPRTLVIGGSLDYDCN